MTWRASALGVVAAGASAACLLAAGPAWAQVPFQADRQFLDQATSAGLAEIMAGQRAEKQGSPAVQEFGRWMVADHGFMNQLLADRGHEIGVELPGQSVQTDASGPDFAGKQGAAFDGLYLKQQVGDHQKAIVLFENEAAQGHDPAIRRIAQSAVPLLREHLAAAQALSQGQPAQ